MRAPSIPSAKRKACPRKLRWQQDTADFEALRTTLWKLSETLSGRMKKAGVMGRGVTLKLKTADFRQLTRSRRLETPSHSPESMFRIAEALLEREADGRTFRLIGIGAAPLIAARPDAPG